MQHLKEKEPWILPVEIGYYGRPISKLAREELQDALLELSKMYMELKRKYIEDCRGDSKRKV